MYKTGDTRYSTAQKYPQKAETRQEEEFPGIKMHGQDERGVGYDLHFTDRVIAATGPAADSRMKQIMPALLRHLHDFAREVNLTAAEWMTGVDMVSLHTPVPILSSVLSFN